MPNRVVTVDRDLVEAARHGDQEAFMDLVRSRGNRLFAIAHRILRDVAGAIRTGGAIEAAIAQGRAALNDGGFDLDYLEVRDARTLGPATPGQPLRLLVAARLGATRLIDNIAV